MILILFKSKIKELLDNYKSLYQGYRNSCNEILRIHHEFMMSLSGYGERKPLVSEENWSKVFRSVNESNKIEEQITLLLEEFSNSPQFHDLSPDEQRTFTEFTEEFTNLVEEKESFKVDFKRRYDEGELPVS